MYRERKEVVFGIGLLFKSSAPSLTGSGGVNKYKIMENQIIITGKDIRDMGFPPGKWYRDAIDHINENKLSKNEIKLYLEQFRLPPSLSLIHI